MERWQIGQSLANSCPLVFMELAQKALRQARHFRQLGKWATVAQASQWELIQTIKGLANGFFISTKKTKYSLWLIKKNCNMTSFSLNLCCTSRPSVSHLFKFVSLQFPIKKVNTTKMQFYCILESGKYQLLTFPLLQAIEQWPIVTSSSTPLATCTGWSAEKKDQGLCVRPIFGCLCECPFLLVTDLQSQHVTESVLFF